MRILSVRLGRGFNVLCAPSNILEKSIKDYTKSCNSPILYIRGRVSISDRGCLHVNEVYTLNQLIELLSDAYEDVIFIEHDPSIFYDVNFAAFEDFVILLKSLGKEKTIVYLSSERDRIFDFIAGLGDRYVYIEEDVNGYYLADVSEDAVNQRFYPKEEERLPLLI